MKILLINGPPGSGKDFAFTELRRQMGIHYKRWRGRYVPVRYAFADILKSMTHGAYGLDSDPQAYEGRKDLQLEEFHGKTPRECYIAMSETYVKPLHGNSFFGRLWSRQVRDYVKGHEMMNTGGEYDSEAFVVATDCGFATEVNLILEEFDPADVMLVELEREGKFFDHDSRSYIADKIDKHPGCVLRLRNPGNEDFGRGLYTEVASWLTHRNNE